MSKFKVNDKVRKTTGYVYNGTVVSVFNTLSNATRYVVENSDSIGMLHIFNENQLAFNKEDVGETNDTP